MKDKEAERVEGEISDEMMKRSTKQEDAARKDREREKHIKAKEGELDEEEGKEGRSICLWHGQETLRHRVRSPPSSQLWRR